MILHINNPEGKSPLITPMHPARENMFRAEMRETLLDAIRRNERNHLTLKIPARSGDFLKVNGMHYHFRPEIFLQLRGETRFTLPNQETLLREGELVIIPTGLPHKEVISTNRGSFRNLVIGFYSNTISIHFAYEAAPGKPDIEYIQFFETPSIDLFVDLSDQLVEIYHSTSSARDYILKGLSTGLLALVLDLVESGNNSPGLEIGKVFQAKWIIREQIANPDLNVKMVAGLLQCSADYLSHLFHSETGEKLIHYIQRIRIQGAIYALETTSLYVSEIAWASGYTDAAYFARIFKKFTGFSPADYRADFQEKLIKKDEGPKSVYFDREDYTPGKPLIKFPKHVA
jgi:AraC-like DNA-binding protein/mannose-6-phosphate isomerase-like protein (cupin superfamily)